jgi:maltoporin
VLLRCEHAPHRSFQMRLDVALQVGPNTSIFLSRPKIRVHRSAEKWCMAHSSDMCVASATALRKHTVRIH